MAVRTWMFWMFAILYAGTSLRADEQLSIEAAGSYGFSMSALDGIAGATYQKKLTNPIAAELALGLTTLSAIYIGTYAEYWIGSAKYDAGAGAVEDKLEFPVLGAELGYRKSNPRTFHHFSIGAGYPVGLQVERVGGSRFRPDAVKLAYRARATVGFRLFHSLWLTLRLGYRLQQMGTFSSSGTPLLASGAGLDLSGVFVGGGLAFVW